MPSANYIFASYANSDLDAVRPILKALSDESGRRGLPVYVWFNQDDLQPGQDWAGTITRALRECIGLLVFVSPRSIASEWVARELLVAMENPDTLIISILLESVEQLPPGLERRQVIDLRHLGNAGTDATVLQNAAERICDSIGAYLQRDSVGPVVPRSAAPALAAAIAEETRDVQQKSAGAATPTSVFVVHGHDNETLNEVNTYLGSLGIKSVVLSKIAGPAQSLFQKFLKSSAEARFAIVIITPDDYGVSRVQYNAEGVGEKALQLRARQNVILELGFFYGQLGWENVFVVYRNRDVYPNFERPSDLDGIVFVEIDATGQWQEVLTDKLVEAGFQPNKPD